MPYNKPDLEENILFSEGRNKGLINCFRPYPNSKNSNLGWLFSAGFILKLNHYSYYWLIMGVVRKSITFTEQQDAYIKSLIEQGFYTNDSEYVRGIIRKDQERSKHMVDLNKALIEGMESGTSNATIDRIWEEALNEYNAGN